MKNLFKVTMLAAFAMVFAACSKDATEEIVPSMGKKTITVTVDAAMTRTVLNDDRSALSWANGDEFGYFTNGTGDAANAKVTYADGELTYTLEVAGDANEVYAYYPFFDGNKSKTAENITLGMGNYTQAEGGVFTGKYYPMAAKATIGEDNTAKMTFKPVASAIAFNVYNTAGPAAGEKVKSITLNTTGAGGYTEYDLTTQAFTDTHSYKTLRVTLTEHVAVGSTKPVDADATKAYKNQIYLMLHKGTYTDAELVVETTANTYTFTGVNLDCNADIATMNLNLSKGSTPPAITYPEPAEGQTRDILTFSELMDSDVILKNQTKIFNNYTFKFGNVASSDSKYVSSDGHIRFYKNETMTISRSGYVIEKIIFLLDDAEYAIAMDVDSGTYVAETGTTIGTWDGSASSVTFTASAGQIRFTGLVIYCKEDSREQLSAPTNVVAYVDATSSNTLNITWDSVANATSYFVSCGDATQEVTTTSATFSELGFETTYNISVIAKSAEYVDSEATTTTGTTGEAPTVSGTEYTIAKDSGLVASTTATAMDENISFVMSAANKYSNPMRIYANTTLTINASKGAITKVVFACGSSTYADNIKNATLTVDSTASASASVDGSFATITITGQTSKLAVKPNAQARVSKIEVTYISE